jgi:hypothetical protein
MHTKNCGAPRDSSPVPLLQVIHCGTRRVVPLDDNPYVTLSYVWGQPQNAVQDQLPDDLPDQLPDDLPNTIEDAITVTQKLGFQYLWIDRYCINQSNKQQAYTQIQQMDSIYRNSALTILAVVGEDPSYGLPGVGSRHRRPRIWAKIGEHTLFRKDDENKMYYNINRSRWASRAWTYQEARLSKRRLVFDNDQVYFECYGMYCYEAIDRSLESLHTEDRQRFDKRYCKWDEKGWISGAYYTPRVNVFPAEGAGASAWDILDRITEYSRLSLTYRFDKLNAFLGILKYYETTYNTRHCWGVPIFAFTNEASQSSAEPMQLAQRYPVAGFALGLDWGSVWGSSEIPKKGDFPSWSWISQKDAVEPPFGDSYSKAREILKASSDSGFQVRVELCNGDVLD